MKLIVNESQYDKLLVEQRGFSKVADDWAHIIVAEVMRYLFRIEGEDTLLMDKLSLKFGDKKFFKKLPISNVIINVSANVIEGTEASSENGKMGYFPYDYGYRGEGGGKKTNTNKTQIPVLSFSPLGKLKGAFIWT